MNIKAYLSTLLAILIIFIAGFFLYQKFSVPTVKYSGLGADEIQSMDIKKDIIIKDDNLDDGRLMFTQRKLTGGGINPGWVVSLIESQPNIFTGRVIVDDGVYQYPVMLREEVTNIYVGEMKSKNGVNEVFALRKESRNCVDEDGHIFEYSLSGTYGSTEITGCGGTVLKINEAI